LAGNERKASYTLIGHRSSAATEACSAGRGRSGHYSGYRNYGSNSYPSYSAPAGAVEAAGVSGVLRAGDQYPEYQLFNSMVTMGTVKKSKIAAYVNRRNEDEILVNSDFVRDRQTFDVTREVAC